MLITTTPRRLQVTAKLSGKRMNESYDGGGQCKKERKEERKKERKKERRVKINYELDKLEFLASGGGIN